MASLRARLTRDRRGATAIEYALIAALIAIGLIGALGVFGGNMRSNFTTVEDRMPGGAPTK